MKLAEARLAEGWLAQITIRQLRAADLPALEWEGAYTHFRRVYARAYERAQAGHAVLWVAEDNGEMLGQIFVLLLSHDTELADGRQRAFIHSFRVRPEIRGRGLGNQLLALADGDLVQRSFQFVSLNVASENEVAIRLYERWGYRRLHPISGDWTYEDHLGVLQHVSEPGWRMGKQLKEKP